MPLVSTEIGESPVPYKMGLWRIDESTSRLTRMCGDARIDARVFDRISHFKSEQRRRETLATHLILHAMTGQDGLYISHNSDGNPIVDGLNISISHTKGYAAVIISRQNRVGIDIEYVSNRVEKVMDYFLRDDEYAPSLTDKIIQWCAKETAYKFFPAPKPQFLGLHSLYDEQSLGRGRFAIRKESGGNEISIRVLSNEEFVLTFTLG